MATFTDHSIQTTLADSPGFPVREETPVMHVRKRNGALEPVDVNKIVRAVQRSSTASVTSMPSAWPARPSAACTTARRRASWTRSPSTRPRR
jgi:hypothetical protein